MLRAYNQAQDAKKEKKEKDEKEEAAFRAKLLEKFAEDDRIELLNEQKKRMKVVQHKREVERLVEEKRRMWDYVVYIVVSFGYAYLIIIFLNGTRCFLTTRFSLLTYYLILTIKMIFSPSFAAEREVDIRALAEQRVEEEKRQVVVEEEKSRLLREHAAAYYDYLPKGMFEKREDYEFVREKAEEAKERERRAELEELQASRGA